MLNSKIFYNISRMIAIFTIIVLIFFSFSLININIIPIKFIILIILSFLTFSVIFTFISFKKINKKILFTFDLLSVLLIILQLFTFFKLNTTTQFLEKNLSQKEEIYTYYVLANKNSEINNLTDINTKEVYLFQDIEINHQLNSKIKEKINKDFIFIEDLSELINNTAKNKNYVSVLNSEIYNIENEENKEITNNIKIIDEFTITLTVENTEKQDTNITEKPFVLYISGIDTRGVGMPARSLSDVNIYMVVRPKEHKILLVHTPRDAYVQLHNTKGLKDKLTHAGSRGGIKLSKATMEDFIGIKADYYIRVNFHAVENLVNAVDGLTIYNDMNYTVHSRIDNKCHYKPGYNNVDGRCALAFARERKSYNTGDKHRGENQEQIIKLLIEKISSSKTLINKYEDILKAMDNTFDTNFTKENIKDLVRTQLENMKPWTIETKNITGEGAMEKTNSYPNQNLYVMLVNQNSLKEAQNKINEYLKI